MILAGIDIGTNTLRLLIAETGPRTLREIQSARTITRLGQGLDQTGILSIDAQDRSIKALTEFKKCIVRHDPARVLAVGTSALRSAENTSSFLADVLDRTGIRVTVISGEQEARLTLLGVEAAIAENIAALNGFDLLVVDIGGGSTEIIQRRLQGIREASLPLGAVYLSERFLRHDPPLIDELDAIRCAIRHELENIDFPPYRNQGIVLVGTAGTITTLAAVDQQLVFYAPERINGSTLSREAIGAMLLKLAAIPIRERRKIPGLEPGREDIILAGSLVIQEIMIRFGFDKLLVSDWGLREGILLDLYDKIITGKAGSV